MTQTFRLGNTFAAPLRSGPVLGNIFNSKTLFQVFQVLRRGGEEARPC